MACNRRFIVTIRDVSIRRCRRAPAEHSPGYSMIECLIVLTILAILATLAQMAWTKHLIQARRTEATSSLLSAAAAQESFFSATRQYAANLWSPAPQGLGLAATEYDWYRLSVESLRDDGFVMAARPSPGSTQLKDKDCLIFTIDHIGRRGSAPARPGVCWR